MKPHLITQPLPRPETHVLVRENIPGGYILRTLPRSQRLRPGQYIEGERSECGVAMPIIQDVP